jgi:hypothetical protein
MKAPIQTLGKAFDSLYEALPSLIAKSSLEDEKAQSSPFYLQSLASKKEDVEKEINAYKQNCFDGLNAILTRLIEYPALSGEVQTLKNELSSSLKKIESPQKFTLALLDVASGKSWREALKIEKKWLEILYQGAKSIYEDGHFDNAEKAFIFLTWFDSFYYDFWMALGNAELHSAQYQKASASYKVASILLPEESWPHIYSASCFEALGDQELALQALNQGLEKESNKISSDTSLLKILKEKIEELKMRPTTPIS